MSDLALPRKFVLMHSEQLVSLFNQCGEVFRIVPREPLGPVSDMPMSAEVNMTVTVITVRCVNINGALHCKAFSQADVDAANAWAKRHRDTTREEFDWLPFTDERAAP